MLPKYHILIGIVLAVILVNFFNFSLTAGIIIFLASFLIDLDHALRYTIKTKNINPFKFRKYSKHRSEKWLALSHEQRKNQKYPIYIFHGVEFWILIIILSFYYPFFFWIFLGTAAHMIADFAFMIYHHDPLDIKLSQIYNLLRNYKKFN